MFSDNERRAMWSRIFALESRMQDVEAATGADEVPLDVPDMNEPIKAVPNAEQVIEDLRTLIGYPSHHNVITKVVVQEFARQFPDRVSRPLKRDLGVS